MSRAALVDLLFKYSSVVHQKNQTTCIDSKRTEYNRTMGAVLTKLLEVFWTKKLDIVVIGLENRCVSDFLDGPFIDIFDA